MLRRRLSEYCFRIGLVILFVWIFTGCTSKKDETAKLSEISATEEGESGEEKAEEAEIVPEESAAAPAVIFVHVCGEVQRPGVYELPFGSRVYEALEAAGGMTEAASLSCLNQAEKVSDGQQIYVLSEEEAMTVQTKESGTSQGEDGKISLNTASKDELMTLTGIGEVKAEAIIRYREDKGGFTSIEELKEIEGIKEGVFNKVKDQIKI